MDKPNSKPNYIICGNSGEVIAEEVVCISSLDPEIRDFMMQFSEAFASKI